MRGWLLALALMLVGTARVGAAPDPKAAAHYKQGKAFLDAKDYDRAITEFEAAFAIDRKPAHLYNIAKAYEGKADFEHAVVFYQRFLDADPPPDPKLAAEVRVLIVAATKARDEALARKQADEAAARQAAEQRRRDEEQAAKRVAAASRVKNAEAFAAKAAWVDAGDEHRAAFEIDGDGTHLIAAGDAYAKAELAKARDAYRAYLDKLPAGGDAELVRGKLADVTKRLEDAAREAAAREAREARERQDREARERRERDRPKRPPHVSFKRGWIVVGGALLVTGLVADLAAPNADNGRLDVSDFAGPALYGLGSIAVLRGVF